jgi:hypothetical protein
VQDLQIVDIAHAIQLALAPVFLLSGIWVFLGVLANRLARIVDRARKMEGDLRQARATDQARIRKQLAVLDRRARHINVAITLGTVAALLVALVVALLFAGTFAPMQLATAVAVLFVLSMVSLIAAFLSFLLEVRIAIAALRIGDV